MKQLFFLIAMLFIGINANAQIGITRNGKIHLEYTDVFYLSEGFTFTEFIKSSIISKLNVALYKPKTKTITIKKNLVTYDAFDEKWVKDKYDDISSYTFTISYNRFGDVDSIITKAYDDFRKKNINYHKIRYYYNSKNRLDSIRSGNDNGWDEALKFKYNNNGELTKAQNRWGGQIYLFEWTPESLLYKISEYKNDGTIDPIMHVNWEGDYIESFYNYNSDVDRPQFLYDSNGFITKIIDGYKVFYIENHFPEYSSNKNPDEITKSYGLNYSERYYDSDGNLIKELYYTINNGQRIYHDGYFYEYTYEFYK